MEKQGMDRRKRRVRAGLLVSLLLLSAVFQPTTLRADEDESAGGKPEQAETRPGGAASENTPASEAAPLEIRIETTPANPMVNNPWAISLLVNHPLPSQVDVTPPRFPPSLILERVRTETRTVAQSGRWTRVEFLFTPQSAGTVTVGSFEVKIPDQKAASEETTVRFRAAAGTVVRYNPRFRWSAPVPSIPSGYRGELLLELSGWDPLLDAPSGFFGGKVPVNVILEEGLPVNTGAGVYLYTIGITPLEDNEISLDPVSFRASTYSLSVPGIKVSVLPAGKEDAAPESVDEPLSSARISGLEEIPPPPFPETGGKIFPLFRGEYNRLCAKAKALWESSRRVEALAEIRRNERDNLAGPFLVPLRREMEQSLGLGFTEDERWRPFRISLLSWAVLGLIILSTVPILFFFRSGFRIRRKNVTSRRRGGFKTIIILVISIGIAFIFLEEGLGSFLLGNFSSPGNSAVLERTPAYRVPDTKGAINLWFSEGQPVIVGDYRLNWCFAETSDGRSGWVRRESVFTY